MESTKNTYNRFIESVENITRIDFSIYSNHDILKDSVIAEADGLTIPEIDDNGIPIKKGAIDNRLGVTENDIKCLTCGETPLTCIGHFGHIKFVEPVFHMGFIRILKDILSCICIRCSKLLIYKNESEINKMLKNKQGKQRFEIIKSITKGVTHCQKFNYGCGTPAHKISIEKKNGNVFCLAKAINKSTETEVEVDNKKNAPQILTPQHCYDILKNMSNEDCIIMGFDVECSRPEDMIIINFPVPPIQVRPTMKFDFKTSADDLTHKIVEIIKSNENLKDIKGDGGLGKSSNINDNFTFLQYHVATFYANDIVGVPRSLQKNKKPTKSLSERLKGKEGRVRGNLMGKRVEMSGRTVITSDPNIGLNEIGVPLMIAKNLTYPEIVTKQNLAYMQKIVDNGVKIYPGANYVIKNFIDKDGKESRHVYSLKYGTRQNVIKPGDIVERHLVDGDILLFNRQPTLHKMSMMAHICHIVRDPSILTFRVNVCVTDPYNADFDGDEMNIHIPQSIQTVTELRLIANVISRFIGPATSRLAIKAKQDAVMGSYVLTDFKKVDWKDAMNLLMATNVKIDHDIPKHKLIDGKFLLSKIIPSNINITKKNESGDIILQIHNSIIKNGILGSSELSTIIQRTWGNFGGKVTKNFIDSLQRMILQYLMNQGFTIGVSDTIIPKKAHDSIHTIIETQRKAVLTLITEYENDPYIMSPMAFETSIRSTLQGISGDIQNIVMNNYNKNNGLYITITSGTKGSGLNAVQTSGCIGQVIVEEKRILERFNNRTLPMFHQYDNSAFARGFCYNSFMSGLNPAEFFFAIMAGREGLINTAIKTAETGYVQRKLTKVSEDIKVDYDGTVRNANDKIIQCVFGDNGVNVEKQIEQKIILIGVDNDTIKKQYIYSEKEITEIHKLYPKSKYSQNINTALYNKLIKMRDYIRKIQNIINTNVIAFKESFMLPVDLIQYITNITANTRKNVIPVDPYYVLKNIKDMYTGKEGTIMKFNTSKKNPIKNADEKKIKSLLKIYLYDVLAPKKCTHLYKLTTDEFDKIVNYFKMKVQLAKVEGGEMVGFVGAQSIGEPITQLNLKSFQKAGTGKTVTGGLARAKELLSVVSNIKTPIMEIILEKQYETDKNIANIIATQLKYTTLNDIVISGSIVYDPNPYDKNSLMSKDNVTNIFESGQGKMNCQPEITSMPWVIRLALSKEKLIDKKITMLEIKTSFCYNWSKRHEDSKGSKKEYKKIISKILQVAIVSNFDNSPEPIIHVRFSANYYNMNTFVQFQEMIITKYKIKGLNNIIDDNDVSEGQYYYFDDDGKKIDVKRYNIMTGGVNLDEIAQFNGIELTEIRCNDIVAVYEKYGVEVARATFIAEFTKAVESSGSIGTNYQHIELLADAITHMGGLIAVNHFGANKLDTDPFSRASFERTGEQLLAAAVFGESDHIRSVSAKIMVGSIINGGTGAFDLLLDHEKIKGAFSTENTKKIIIPKKDSTISDLIRKKKNT